MLVLHTAENSKNSNAVSKHTPTTTPTTIPAIAPPDRELEELELVASEAPEDPMYEDDVDEKIIRPLELVCTDDVTAAAVDEEDGKAVTELDIDEEASVADDDDEVADTAGLVEDDE